MMTVKNTSSAIEAVTMMWLVTVNVYGMMPIMFAIRMNMNSVKTSGKNFMPAVPAVLCMLLATNSYVSSVTDCIRPGTSARDGAAADQQRGDADDRDRHEQRRIGDRDLVPADVAERGELGDLELMNWIGHRTSPAHDLIRKPVPTFRIMRFPQPIALSPVRWKPPPRVSRSTPRRRSRAKEKQSSPTASFRATCPAPSR